MAENHLEYGYLEGESIAEHFAEDPVGIARLYVVLRTKRVPSRLSFVRT